MVWIVRLAGKHQVPSSKHQRSSKPQAPIGAGTGTIDWLCAEPPESGRKTGLKLGAWASPDSTKNSGEPGSKTAFFRQNRGLPAQTGHQPWFL
jgi:hypothetical protein